MPYFYLHLILIAIIVGFAISASIKTGRIPCNVDKFTDEQQKLIVPSSLLTFGTITDMMKFAQNKNCNRRRHSHEKAYFCPSAPSNTDPSDWPCVTYTDLCDLRPDCPGKEDENPTFCMFHQLVSRCFLSGIYVPR
ncbi:unnamed protein product [Toxocara canis]|uniref:Secreted protein n=1 Tax=Toxocara canis TaxID=6265 RepID=A0A183U128_TOXCA|nr:unnamed protein product [Toxocara canis]